MLAFRAASVNPSYARLTNVDIGRSYTLNLTHLYMSDKANTTSESHPGEQSQLELEPSDPEARAMIPSSPERDETPSAPPNMTAGTSGSTDLEPLVPLDMNPVSGQDMARDQNVPASPIPPANFDLEASGTVCLPRPIAQSSETRPAAESNMLDGEELAQGDDVGQYIIREMIGRGGCGTVYAATHDSTDEEVAVKVLRLSLAGSPHQVRRFVQEAQALKLVDHPGIVKVYDTGYMHDGRPYFVMELLEGRSLANLLGERGRLSPREALAILEPICDMLELAHQAGIVHRDIKASNIMLTGSADNREIKLLDFGLAKLLNSDQSGSMQTSMGVVLGTLHSMAPEQIMGGTVDGRTDIYAMGALLHRLLTGRHPFEDVDGQKVARMHLHKPPPKPSKLAPVSPALDALVERALDKDPGRRFQTAGAFLEALRDAVVSKSAEVQQTGDAVAIYVEGRIAEDIELDESFFSALMQALDSAERAFVAAGFQILVQTTNAILAARIISVEPNSVVLGGKGEAPAPPRLEAPAIEPQSGKQPAALDSAIEVATELHRTLGEIATQDGRFRVNVCLHRDRAEVKIRNDQPRIIGGAIGDLSYWAPQRDLDRVCIARETGASTDIVSYVSVPAP